MKKAAIIIVPVLLIAALVVWFTILGPQAELEELAMETCDELDGAIVLQAGPILKGAVGKADRLGFSGPELGDAMREHCWGIVDALQKVSEKHAKRD